MSAGRLFIKVRPGSITTPGFASALGGLVRKHGLQPAEVVLALAGQRA